MNLHLSAAAWAALGCLLGLVLLSAVVLWAAWRRGRHAAGRGRSPFQKVETFGLDRPWEKEDARFAELARVAHDLRARRQDPSAENKTGE